MHIISITYYLPTSKNLHIQKNYALACICHDCMEQEIGGKMFFYAYTGYCNYLQYPGNNVCHKKYVVAKNNKKK